MPIRLDTDVPGWTPRPAPESARPAAVLVLVAPDRDGPDGLAHPDAEAEVILIERVDRGGHHSGEISFPGGGADAGEDAVATALREAAEEVGLDVAAAAVRVIGHLETFWIPVSDYRVHPVLAIAASRPRLTGSMEEVASIIRAPLSAFVGEASVEIVETTIREMRLRYGAYPVLGHHVWGATARVLGQLGALLSEDRVGDPT
jgi:8-oxo-dGTP pyrophosphatase MutT (NUDIX family)